MRLVLWSLLQTTLGQSTVQAQNSSEKDKKRLALTTTTDTENSGLLEYLLTAIERQTDFTVHVITIGTGLTLRMGQDNV